MAWAQAKGHAQRAQTQLLGAGLIRIVPHQILAQVFHVMHVQAHVVAQAVRLEEAGDALGYHLVQVSLYQAQGAEALQHLAGRGQVYFPVGNAGLGQGEGQLVAFIDNLVNLPLFLRELAAGGIGAGEVAGIVLVALHAGVNHHKFAGFNHSGMAVVVQGFSVLGEDGGERNAPALGQRHSFHLTHNFLFDDADLDGIPGGRMHLVAQVAGVVQRFNFDGFFDQALRNDGFDECLGGLAAGRQLLQPEGVEIAAGRQEMDRPSALKCQGHGIFHGRIGRGVGDTHGIGLGTDTGLRAHPDDIVNIHIIGKEGFRTGVDVQDGGHQGLIQAPVIEPGAVLTPFVAVVLVLGRSFGVSYEKNDAALTGFPHLFGQFGATTNVYLFCKHVFGLFVSSKIRIIFVLRKPLLPS